MNAPLLLSLCALLGAAISPAGLAQDPAAAASEPAETGPASPNAEREALLEQIGSLLLELENDGASSDKLEAIGDLYLKAGDARRATLLFQKAIADFGGSEALFTKAGRLVGALGGPELAVTTLGAGLERFPGSELLTYELGKAYLQLERPYAAASNLKKAIEMSPEREAYRYHLADAYRQQEKWAEAAEIVDALIAQDTEMLQAYLMKGDLLLAQGQLDEAARWMEELLEEHPESDSVKRFLAHTYQTLAYAESRAGRLESATASIRRALEMDPGNGVSLLALGSLLSERGEHEAAEAAFKELLQRHPNHLDGYVSYGRMLEALDRTPEAATQYQKGLAKAREHGVEGAISAFRKLLRIRD